MSGEEPGGELALSWSCAACDACGTAVAVWRAPSLRPSVRFTYGISPPVAFL